MTRSTDILGQEYTIETPENVSIDYQVAGIGNRFIAALIDSAILGGTLIIGQILLLVALAALGNVGTLLDDSTADWQQGLVLAVYALVSFALFWGYFIVFEWLWNGQTPGKRVGKIRVVRMDGSPPSFLDIAVRNLMRIIDFLPFGYGVGLAVMFFNGQSRRLGDLAAGVMVVKDRGELRLEDITSPLTRPLGEPHRASLASSTAPQPRSESMPQLNPQVDPQTDSEPPPEPSTVEPPTPKPGFGDPQTGTRQASDPQLRYPAIRRLRVADYELMQKTLLRHDAGTLDAQILTRLAQAMHQKAGGSDTPTSRNEGRRLLNEIMEAYRDYHQA